MRTILPTLLLFALGCQHCPRVFDCSNSCVTEEVECPKEACRTPKRVSRPVEDCPPERVEKKPAEVCEKPQVEKKTPQTIHIKMPQERIIVHVDQHGNPISPQQLAMMQQQQAQSFTPQSFAPQPGVQPQSMVMMPVVQPQSAPSGRARPGLTIDFFRLPIPFPRLIAVPDAPQQVQMAMFQPQSFVPVPQQQTFQPQSFVPQPQQQAFVPQSFSPQPQIFQPQSMMPVQGSVNIPVQGTVNVPVQGHVPVPVQPQSFVPQSAAVQPQSLMVPQQQRVIPVVPQSFTPQSAVVAQPQMQGISLEQAREFCRLVKELEDRMKQK